MLIAGDGLIPQIERFASKIKYAKMNVNIMSLAMDQMSQKAKNSIGNHFVFIVNNKLWSQVNLALGDWLKNWKSTPTMVYSKDANKGYGGMVGVQNPLKVGATFVSYEVNGNTISFMVDPALTKEYGDKGFGVCLDMAPDVSLNQPAIASFTLEGAEFTSSKYPGIGGIDGITSGIVSSPVAGSKLIVNGYAGIAAFAPFKSFIMEEI